MTDFEEKLIFGAVLAVGGYLLYRKVVNALPSSKEVTQAAQAAVQAVNPTSDQNLAYKAASAVTQAATGNANTSFGSWLYDVTHPNDAAWITAPVPANPINVYAP